MILPVIYGDDPVRSISVHLVCAVRSEVNLMPAVARHSRRAECSYQRVQGHGVHTGFVPGKGG